MSAPNKSIDKNKRYAGVKANDFVNKTRTNETSRATARTQGWANLGKINSRRIPPPANLPSLKSETGTNPPAFDPTLPTGTSHGWTASGTSSSANSTRPLTPSKQPTQQQLDSLPAHSSTPPPTQSSTELDKPRLSTTWSTVTAGNNSSNDQPPNLLALNDFPRLVTQDAKSPKSPSDSLISSLTTTTNQGPSFRPANLASWKEGGGRAQPVANDSSKDASDNSLSMQSAPLTTNTNSIQGSMSNSTNSSYMRMYPQQMWSYNSSNSYSSYGPNQAPPSSMPMHHQQSRMSSYSTSNQSHNQQRMSASTDYKTPTILRNKDIDDLSKLTDNVTWASASQEVNYEEKIRFSDDEDNDTVDHNPKSRRMNHSQQQQQQQQQSRQTYPQVLQNTNRPSQSTRSRLLQDDEHVKQMQDDKNSELISTLTVAKQRRDEQERHLRDQRTNTSTDQKQIPGYQTRPLLTSSGQENLPTSKTDSSLWRQTNSGTTTTTTTATTATTATTTTATTRTRHDTADSQTFTMKSWSDQMEFNYASLHEKSGAQVGLDDDSPAVSTNRTRKYSRSQSESSSQSQPEDNSSRTRSKHFPLPTRIQTKSNVHQIRPKSKTADVIDYFERNDTNMKSNEQWGDWEESSYSNNNNNNRYQQSYANNDRRRPQQQQQQQQQQQYQKSSEDLVQKSTRYNEQNNDFNRTKPTTKTKPNVSRTSDGSSSVSAKPESKPVMNKSQPAWRPLSPTRQLDSNDPTPQEAITYKTQTRTNDMIDRRQPGPGERKSRYNTTTTPIDTASIPPLMSVRSDVPPSTVTSAVNSTASKHFKTSNQSQRQDYNTSSHYSQRNDFYTDTNDSGWGNDDEYYDDETGYYDPNLQTHQRHTQSIGYHAHSHHRGYTTLGSYGRYRRGGTLRHQQQYSTYHTNNATNASSQLNTSTGSKTKKTPTNRTTIKKSNELLEPIKPVEEPTKLIPDETTKKPSAWSTEPKTSIVEEIPIFKSVETPALPLVIEKSKEPPLEQKSENENTLLGQTEIDSTALNKKSTTTTTAQKKSNRDQQNYYQNQQAPRHRNTYARSTQDYDTMQMATHQYYTNNNRRPTRGGRNARLQDLSSDYYYDPSQQRYNSRYGYSTGGHYQQQSQTRSGNKNNKRANSATTDRQQTKSTVNTGTNNLSDNDQKEGEEWETASESSANMRINHHEPDPPASSTEIKPIHHERTPPKKSFASQRPINTRHYESGVHRRSHNIYERGSKSTRGIRTSRSTTNQKPSSSPTNEDDNSTNRQSKKDPHRHSLDGYDLNNVAGVVKIETLPASALEEESTAFDDGGEEFCVVMSKRGRKEQKAAQLSKQNAADVPTEQTSKSASIDADEQANNEKSSTDPNQANSTRSRNGKSLPPRFGSNKSSATRQSKADQMYYYDQNYYYYDQNQYYDHDGSYYNYGNYGTQTHRQSSTRRKPRNQTQQENNPTSEVRKTEPEKPSSNVMSNIQMWNPHTDTPMSHPSRLIEKPTQDRKFANEIVPSSSSNDTSLSLPLTTHSPGTKPTETIARTIKPPTMEKKSERESKAKSTNFEKPDAISSLGSNQLFEKSTFLDYDDKQSIGTVGDDYNQKINSLKTIWDISDHPSVQLEQTINSMVAMQQQHQDGNVQSNNSNKSDNYVQESIAPSSSNANTNVSSTNNDDSNNKNSSTTGNLQSTGSSSTINQSSSYSSNPNPSKNEQKVICTVKPTQQVPPNIQDQVDVNAYQTFAAPPLPPPMSQASLQQQQHLLPQSQVNPLHQQHTYQFYENILPQQQQPPPPQQQPPFNRMYSSTTNSTGTDPINSDFSSTQSSQLYPPQNFSYRNANVYMQPPNVPNTNSMYHHTAQGSISAPPQNNAMPPPPMPNYPSPFLVDHGGHMIGQAQPPQAYMNNQMMSGRPQGAPYYRTPPQQQLPTPPGPPYGTQDPLAHGGYYPPFFQAPNSNAPPVGHPSPHNLYGQNEGFHPPPPPPPHPQMFPRGGSIDRGDHPLMSQPLSRPNNYPSNSSNQQQQPPPPPPPQGGPPPSLLSQNIKPFHANQPPTSSSNQAPFYPPPNQYNRQPMPIGAIPPTNNRQQTQQVPSLMSGLNKNYSNNGNNLNNTPSLFQHRQPLLHPQSNNNRPIYQHHNQYSTYSKSTGPNDDNAKPKHI